MSYTSDLESLSEEKLHKLLIERILDEPDAIINDKSRIDLLDDHNPQAWDEIDEILIHEVSFDAANQCCKVEFSWESWASGCEDDERRMLGHGFATIREQGIDFESLRAELED